MDTLGSATLPSTPDTTASTSHPNESEATTLLAHVTQQQPLAPTDLRRILSSSQPSSSPAPAAPCDAHHHNVVYTASKHCSVQKGALIDQGANGGIAGDDVRLICKTGHQVDVQGIDDHHIVDIPLVSAGAVVKTQRGDAIIIMHQYAYTGKGRTIHSSAQLEHFKQVVDDRAIAVGGKQQITTLDGYVIPINIKGGLSYISMHPYTDSEWDSLPHITLTSDTLWDPSILDMDLDDDETWYDAVSDLPIEHVDDLFDCHGDYHTIQLTQFTNPSWAQTPISCQAVTLCMKLMHVM